MSLNGDRARSGEPRGSVHTVENPDCRTSAFPGGCFCGRQRPMARKCARSWTLVDRSDAPTSAGSYRIPFRRNIELHKKVMVPRQNEPGRSDWLDQRCALRMPRRALPAQQKCWLGQDRRLSWSTGTPRSISLVSCLWRNQVFWRLCYATLSVALCTLSFGVWWEGGSPFFLIPAGLFAISSIFAIAAIKLRIRR